MKLLSKILTWIKNNLESYKRVLVIARKPDKEDLQKTLRICLIIMAIIGFIGFVFYTISILFIG
ncbi:MAG: protein translocase SEC61 complex subunit gamma [Candidatus Aenigmarchaeota archaeon]|nr:protein translocase SEC61 complex subunit gamma [Candidatus Aenigmarchaeota archaeon]MCX8190767.1 protein translocase SEC61 complex subunit gamma [Candidatus Aenigmarchaeota archaeon]MDW8160014.1 protein translocase SEC61 complex subunit gamma [Candidatus Aenigmarchaeota archaeon]